MSVAGINRLSDAISKGLVIMHALIQWVVQWLKTGPFVLRPRQTGTLIAQTGHRLGSYQPLYVSDPRGKHTISE